MDELRLKIVTPDREFYNDTIDMLVAKSELGEFAILKNHLPMVASLQISYLKIKKDGNFRFATIAGGYMTMKDNEIVVISDAVEWREEIDKDRAIRAKEEAERRLQEAKDSSSFDRAELELKKAINRLNIKDL